MSPLLTHFLIIINNLQRFNLRRSPEARRMLRSSRSFEKNDTVIN